MPFDHYVTLGRSGLRVSPYCLGGFTFGPEKEWGSSVEVSTQIIDHFLDRGGNFIDTANGYNNGHSEKIIGDHIGKHPSRRDRVVLATKFSTNLYSGDPNGGGAGRKSLIAACEQSLRRLQTDYIDLYWMHWWDPFTPIDEVMRALDDLVSAGKVRYIGFSDTPAWKVAEAQVTARFRGWAPLTAIQIEYSLLERSVEGELIPMALEMGLGVTPWGPLGSGVLSGKYARENVAPVETGRADMARAKISEAAFQVLDVVRTIARECETTPACVALAWLAQRPGVASIVMGARTLEQLEGNMRAADLSLTLAQIHELDKVSSPPQVFPMNVLSWLGCISAGGLTINGETNPPEIYGPITDANRH